MTKGKAPVHLLARFPVEDVVRVLQAGDEQYGTHNWHGETFSRVQFAAKIIRHTLAWLRGEDADPDDGASHIAHAAADALIILEMERAGLGVDDRIKRP